MNEPETVSKFLCRSFRLGTTPIPQAGQFGTTPASNFGFNLIDWVKNRECDLLKKDLIKAWPIWPPDLFAVTATLVEQSGTYLRMVFAGENPSSEMSNDGTTDLIRSSEKSFADDTDWPTDVVALIKSLTDKKSLEFSDETLKVCRVVGALWRQGCLFISGDDGALSAEVLCCAPHADKIRRQLRINVDRALYDLAHKFRSEFKERDIDEICNQIITKFLEKGKRTARNVDFSNYERHTGLSNSSLYVHLVTYIGLNKKTLISEYEKDDSAHRDHSKFQFALTIWAMEFITSLWEILIKSDDLYIPKRNESDLNLKDWQVACMLLLMIADEASRGIGYSKSPEQVQNSKNDKEIIAVALEEDSEVGLCCHEIWETYVRRMLRGPVIPFPTYPRNLGRMVDETVASVLPKSRTPATGCTIRSLTHNLALLPSKGRIRARWAQQAESVVEQKTFNLLIIPYPFEIHSSDVEPHRSDQVDKKRWGRFSVNPGWLDRKPRQSRTSRYSSAEESNEALWTFVKELIEDQATGVIDGIVFPEGSLTYNAYKYLSLKIIEGGDKYQSITLLVSGVTTDANESNPKRGNFVATYVGRSDNGWNIRSIRSKHHRWSLNKAQLASYALSNRLAPDKIWWEDIDLPPREMLFAEFSHGSILTTLICEDLARIDPCQVALRAVGPNLTLVLLMDSAQITSRWPAQYAGVLADDPGTSVLTLTSFGLLRRANFSENHKSRAIALWREPLGGAAREIELPAGYHAQLISLRREHIREVTLDGRGDAEAAVVWRLAGIIPIRVSDEFLPPGYPQDAP